MQRIVWALSSISGVLRNVQLRRVELAWGASVAAEWANFVALGVFAYDVGGTLAVGLAGLVRLLPAALVAPFAAFVGDRFRRERFLVAISAGGCLALAGSAAVYFVDRNEYVIFPLASIFGLSSTLLRPALQALLPSLARTPEELIASNGATSTIEGLATLVGPLVAGVLIAATDPGVVFALAGAALLAAALFFARVHVEGRMRTAAASGAQSLRRALLAGYHTVLRARRARLVVGLIVAQTFVRGCLNVLIVVTAFRVLHAGPGAVGYMTAAIGVGGLVGAFAALALVGRRLATPFGLALVVWGLPIALVAPRPYLALALVLLALVGAANSVEDVAGFTLLQRVVPDELLTRVLGVVWGLAMGALALGSISAPAVVSVIGPRPALVVVGAILPVLTLVTWRGLVEIDRSVAAPAEELAVIEGVPMFAPLSIAAKEHLAATLTPVSVVAGDVVIRAGDVGDRFYIVRHGDLEVVAPGVRATAGDGDYFGEIALIRDVPRTATVTALADSQLYAMDRNDFLAAVTSHSGVQAAGEVVVEQRHGTGARVGGPA
ncbi:MAG TPA: MFS transporter [Gaiellaceae bacterium]